MSTEPLSSTPTKPWEASISATDFTAWMPESTFQSASGFIDPYFSIDAATLAGHKTFEFTRRFGDTWEGVDHAVTLGSMAAPR